MVARRHHYVPQCYLESFATKTSRKKKSELWVFDSVNRTSFRTAPDNVALQKDFNTIDLEGHEPDAFENAMSTVESDIGPALIRIIEARSLKNEEDKALLLNLIGLVYIRNPRLREQARSFRERVAKAMLSMVLSTKQMWDSHIASAKQAGYIPKDADTDYNKHKNMNLDDYRMEVENEAHIDTEMHVFDNTLRGSSSGNGRWSTLPRNLRASLPVTIRLASSVVSRASSRSASEQRAQSYCSPSHPRWPLLGPSSWRPTAKWMSPTKQ